MKVVARTDKMGRDEWLEHRRKGIGGSDLSIILGKSKYRSPFALWADKTGRVVPDQAGDAAQWGHDLEETVAKRFAKDHNCAVVQWPVLLQSDLYPFMLANLDYLVVQECEEFPAGEITLWDSEEVPPEILHILEIKTTGIVGRGSGHLWEKGGVPEGYELQGHHYSIVTGIKSVIFAGLIAGSGLQVRGRLFNSYEKDMEIIERESSFWSQVFEDVWSEEPDGSESTLEAIHQIYPSHSEGEVLVADDDLESLIQEYRLARKDLDEAEAYLKEIRSKIELRIRTAEKVINAHSQVLLTYRSNKVRDSFNLKAFRETCPDIYQNFTETVPGSRVLRLGRD